MDPSEGRKALEIARKAVELWVREGEKLEPGEYPESFREKRGVFVTISTYPGKRLRGCIGIPEPVVPMIEALLESAISATMDPRFEVLVPEELNKIIIEVSLLTKPELIQAEPGERPRKIEIGRDGLIVRKSPYSGLLLPQVAVEHKMSPEEFLEHTCLKAGLDQDAWLDRDTEVYRFRAEVFSEKAPKKN